MRCRYCAVPVPPSPPGVPSQGVPSQGVPSQGVPSQGGLDDEHPGPGLSAAASRYTPEAACSTTAAGSGHAVSASVENTHSEPRDGRIQAAASMSHSSSSSRTNSNGNSSNSDGNSCRPTPISDGCSRRFKARLFSLLRRTPGLPDAGLPDARIAGCPDCRTARIAGLPLAVLIRQRGHMTMARPPGVHSARCRPAQIAFRSSPAAGFHTQSVSRRCDHGCSLPASFRSCGRD